MKVVELTGQRFGRLLVQRRASARGGPGKHAAWECLCDCGSLTTARSNNLRKGSTTSCGCYGRVASITHGEARANNGNGSPEYRVWRGMRGRCHSPRNSAFRFYGGRGITVCDRWLNSYENFLADMGRRPSPHHSIDRIDNDRGYEPGNCRWATMKAQTQNRSNNRKFTHKGETLCLTEWARRAGIPQSTLSFRLARGLTFEEAVRRPLQRAQRRSGGMS